MRKRNFGKNGTMLTEIGLGTWAIGGPWRYGWGPQDDRDSIRTIHKAMDLGLNWLDTAPVYGLGHSEEIVAEALRGKEDKMFLATKCGLVWGESGKIKNNATPASIQKEVEDSLRRLRVDCIDLYQIHWPAPDTPVERSWAELTELKKQGKVRYIGVSNFGVQQMEKCEKIHHVDSLQPHYSLVSRDIEKDILPWCLENKVSVIAYSPMESGLLTGKFHEKKLADDDMRRKEKIFQEPLLSKNLKFVDALRPIAAKYGKSVAQLAIAWVLMHPAVTAAIVGARHPQQIEEIGMDTDWKIEQQDMELIEQKSQQFLS